jgi:hypothetical protein
MYDMYLLTGLPSICYNGGAMKGLPMGFYVVGRLMAVEDIQLPSGKRKRLSVFYGDTRLLLIYADPDVEVPPLDTVTTFAVSRLNVDKRGNLIVFYCLLGSFPCLLLQLFQRFEVVGMVDLVACGLGILDKVLCAYGFGGESFCFVDDSS